MKINKFTRKLKKILSLTGAAAIFAAFPAMAAYAEPESAEDVIQDGSFIYEEVDGGYAVKRCTASIITSFPGIVNGVSIVEIKDGAFADCSALSEINIPSTVKKMGKNTFVGCTSLKKVTIPPSITEIPENTFVGCVNLTEVDLPDNLTEIGKMAFHKCYSLTDIELPDSVTKIGDSAFFDCVTLNHLTLPDSLTEIGDMAFGYAPIETFDTEGCSAFKVVDNILYNSNETKIYRAAPSISGDVYIKDGVQEINGGAFSFCQNITSLFIPDSVTRIGGYGFSECTSMTSVKFSEGLKQLDTSSFAYNTALESVELPVSLETMGESAFMYCTSLKKVIMQENLKEIGNKAFFDCPALTQVTVPKSVTEVGADAFGKMYDDNGNIISVKGFSMSVTAGSAGAKYAKSNGIEFKSRGVDLKLLALIVVSAGILVTAIVFGVVLMSRSKKGASRGAKKARKEAKEREAEKNYKKITGNDDDNECEETEE